MRIILLIKTLSINYRLVKIAQHIPKRQQKNFPFFWLKVGKGFYCLF
ncbi:hypothetical protein BACFRA24663_00380 [Bacteroides fragilis]